MKFVVTSRVQSTHSHDEGPAAGVFIRWGDLDYVILHVRNDIMFMVCITDGRPCTDQTIFWRNYTSIAPYPITLTLDLP